MVGSKLSSSKLFPVADFPVAVYSAQGDRLQTEKVITADLDSNYIDYFDNKFRHLSGDLELPLEDQLPGGFDYLEYRIGSDRNGAYVLYYFHDEVIFASLMLSGTESVVETELMQVFRFLLLDTQDDDEPTEEEIEQVLASEAFDFESLESRPAIFEVQLSDPAPADETIPVNHVIRLNRHLGAAFFAIDRTESTPPE